MFVVLDVDSPALTLDPSVLPNTTREIFIVKTLADVKAELQKRKRDRHPFIRFSSIDSDGSCAIVTSGRGLSFDTDVYEKRGDHWSFVRRVGGSFLD